MGARHTKRPSGQDATATDAVVPGAAAVRPRAGRLSSRSRLSDTGDKSGACSRRAARTSGGSAGTASLARVPPAGQRTGRAWSRRRPGFPCKGAPVIDVLRAGPGRSPGIVDFRPFVRPRLHDLPTMGNTPGVRESYTNRSHRHVGNRPVQPSRAEGTMDDARLFLCTRCRRQVLICPRWDRAQQHGGGGGVSGTCPCSAPRPSRGFPRWRRVQVTSTTARPEGAQGLAVDQVTEAVAALDTSKNTALNQCVSGVCRVGAIRDVFLEPVHGVPPMERTSSWHTELVVPRLLETSQSLGARR